MLSDPCIKSMTITKELALVNISFPPLDQRLTSVKSKIINNISGYLQRTLDIY